MSSWAVCFEWVSGRGECWGVCVCVCVCVKERERMRTSGSLKERYFAYKKKSKQLMVLFLAMFM